MIIADRTIERDGDSAFVVAEVGHNHQGSLDKCIELFKSAAACGADAVKIQKRTNKSLYTSEMYNQPYHSENAYADTYGEHREYLEFGKSEYLELKNVAEQLGLIFFATAFDFEAVDFLEDINLPAYKVASGDLQNVPLIKYIASTNKPMFISTGGAYLKDVCRAVEVAHDNICVMQCTSGYPAEAEELNLRVIQTYLDSFGCVVGLSDHHVGIESPVLAYMLGARVFEKHFTLNRTWKGTDQAFSLEPAGLKKVVRDLKNVPLMLGDGTKKPFNSEQEPLRKMGKMQVASRDLPAGHILTESDINYKSPCDGIPPHIDLVGVRLNKPLKRGEAICDTVKT